jgi:hypothetical protein
MAEDNDFMEGFDNDESYGFMAVNEDELKDILGGQATETATPEEISAIKSKLDMILEMNSTCEGANAVKSQYDELLKAKLGEIQSLIFPLLINLKKNSDKDYLYWPGSQRSSQCELQMQKILNLTQSS